MLKVRCSHVWDDEVICGYTYVYYCLDWNTNNNFCMKKIWNYFTSNTTAFLLVNALSPSGPFSFPYQDFLTPPNGSDAFDPAGLLIKIIHPSRRSATSFSWSISSHRTVAESQKSELFARAIASSVFFALITDATGQKSSSRKLVISGVTSASRVGA